MATEQIIRSDLGAYESSYRDKLRDILTARMLKRREIDNVIRKMYPEFAEDLLNREQRRLLNQRGRAAYLSASERQELADIENLINRYNNGGCINIPELNENNLIDENRILKIDIPGIPGTICFDYLELINGGFISPQHLLGEANLTIQNSTVRYPLTQDEVRSVVEWADTYGINIIRTLIFPDLDTIRNNIILTRRSLTRYD